MVLSQSHPALLSNFGRPRSTERGISLAAAFSCVASTHTRTVATLLPRTPAGPSASSTSRPLGLADRPQRSPGVGQRGPVDERTHSSAKESPSLHLTPRHSSLSPSIHLTQGEIVKPSEPQAALRALSLQRMIRKFPGRIQEGRRPGGLTCSRPGPGAVGAGAAAPVPGRPTTAPGRPISATSTAALGNGSGWGGEAVGRDREGATSSGGSGTAEEADAHVKVQAQGSSPWMGLVLPALTKNVAVAASALRSADIIALPTDTIYGIAGDARSPVAVERIYDTKGRDARKPLPICVADAAQVATYAQVGHLPAGLLDALLPGPVTVVLPYDPSGGIAPAALAGLSTVGIRVPDAVFVRAVAKELGGPLALTSANASSAPSSLSVDEFRGLWGQCACIFDSGPQPAGHRPGSTIVELLSGQGAPGSAPSCTFRIIRPGSAEARTRECLKKFGVTQEH